MHAQYDGTAAAKQHFKTERKPPRAAIHRGNCGLQESYLLDPNFMEAHQRYLQRGSWSRLAGTGLMSSGKKLSPKQQETDCGSEQSRR